MKSMLTDGRGKSEWKEETGQVQCQLKLEIININFIGSFEVKRLGMVFKL